MEHVPAGEQTTSDTTRSGPRNDTGSDTAGARRSRMRQQARAQRPGTTFRGFETPEWLDKSFVLPLTQPELTPQMTDVPHQSVPHHDDESPRAPKAPARSEQAFVRPPTTEVDFAGVIRRSDQTRTATRAALGSTALTGVLLIAFLLTGAPVVLGMTIAFALVALVATGVRLRLAGSPLPRL